MNIQLPYSWVSDYIKTSATPKQVADILSLHSFSVEKITTTKDDDSIFEIEVTPNRYDALSIIGIARELKVLLPRCGYTCEWIDGTKEVNKVNKNYPNTKAIDIVITNKDLVTGYASVIIDNVSLRESSKIVQDRLIKSGIRPINNIVDITNYIMVELGQPMHAFDHDQIAHHKMLFRESLEGETITTLDGIKRKLPKGAILIEDGDNKIIDLCGIMGGENSAISDKTSTVMFLAPIYEKTRIRKASMYVGNRTDAALRFEKGLDQSMPEKAINKSIEMSLGNTNYIQASEVTTSLQNKTPEVQVEIDSHKICKIAGMEIDTKEIENILINLGFEIKDGHAIVPSWRIGDISIVEDLAEEIIRVYGYENIKGELPTEKIQSSKNAKFFEIEDKIKDILKFNGFFECYTNSATTMSNVDKNIALLLKNPLTKNFHALRTSLIPQLIEVVDDNKGFKNVLKFFEVASVYHRNTNDDLPSQPVMLGIVTKNFDYLSLKGLLTGLYDELNLEAPESIIINEHGENVLSAEINLEKLLDLRTTTPSYTPISSYNSFKEDLTLIVPSEVTYSEITTQIYKTSDMVKMVSYKDLYNNCLTISLEYLDRESQVDSAVVQKIREKILVNLFKLGVTMQVTP